MKLWGTVEELAKNDSQSSFLDHIFLKELNLRS